MTTEQSFNTTTSSIPEGGKDELLWKMAKKRASFKWSLLSYILVNGMLVAIWYLTSGEESYFWPIWPMLGWGIGIAMHYFEAYYGNTLFSAEDEYQKLKNKQL